MQLSFPRFRPIVLVALVAISVSALAGAYALGAQRGAAPTPTRQALAGSDNPNGTKNRTLGLFRVSIPAGSQLPLHRHPGTQVAFIQEGKLTYTVRDGTVDVMRGDFDASPKRVRRIGPGQTGSIRAGEWIVEGPNDIHRAANNGSKRVVVLLSTLLKTGSPPSIPVESG